MANNLHTHGLIRNCSFEVRTSPFVISVQTGTPDGEETVQNEGGWFRITPMGIINGTGTTGDSAGSDKLSEPPIFQEPVMEQSPDDPGSDIEFHD